ncbi:MAG: ATP-grasp enzyme [Mycobacteriaceae bacterium]
MRARTRSSLRTVGMVGLLAAVAPINVAVTVAGYLRSALRPTAAGGSSGPSRTILISGGKMTKALVLARAFHADGHRVVLVEQARYRLTGHRFSRAVDAFHTVPRPEDPGYTAALRALVEREGVDVYVPVCSPVASYYDSLARQELDDVCEVIHPRPDELRQVDDKSEFAALAQSLGLRVPDTHRITDPRQVAEFDFTGRERSYILKSIVYDPVRRLDLTRLPRPTPEETVAYVASLPISAENPWILQEFIPGQEYCTHGTVRDGEVQVWCCCESSASQLNYTMVEVPEIEEWVRTFCRATKMTGQLSFDFIVASDGASAGEVFAIECNPRTHSAISMFYNHPDLSRAYLDSGVETITPLPGSRPTYWLYHEVWRLITLPHRWSRLHTILTGTDAIFSSADPLPFLAVHHLQIPWLLLVNLVKGGRWVKIDVNIGKLVEPGGD